MNVAGTAVEIDESMPRAPGGDLECEALVTSLEEELQRWRERYETNQELYSAVKQWHLNFEQLRGAEVKTAVHPQENNLSYGLMELDSLAKFNLYHFWKPKYQILRHYSGSLPIIER
ncbi:unnamed protein product [Protopolystoma xenopodis]|uniref:Uncharacterized protein n=1 Tax=Protopolystoma xenopodis TaxID=117903 RepID=A0A448WQH3_9PLAT|nr:unnamed protein product [Protopolystoma xenopodis]